MSKEGARKLARRGDPATSKLAAESIAPILGKQQRWCYECLRQAPGVTQREGGNRFSPEDHRKFGRRLNELETLGMAYRGPARKCTISGRPADTWWPVLPGDDPPAIRTNGTESQHGQDGLAQGELF